MFTAKTAAILLASATAVLGQTISVNYYTDGGCTQWASTAPDVPFQSNYNWHTDGVNSANIAECTYSYCICTFYTQPNSGGAQQSVSNNGYDGYPSCASNWSEGFASFWCSWGSITRRDEDCNEVLEIEGEKKGNLAAVPFKA
jgi:hypothetical protein